MRADASSAIPPAGAAPVPPGTDPSPAGPHAVRGELVEGLTAGPRGRPASAGAAQAQRIGHLWWAAFTRGLRALVSDDDDVPSPSSTAAPAPLRPDRDPQAGWPGYPNVYPHDDGARVDRVDDHAAVASRRSRSGDARTTELAGIRGPARVEAPGRIGRHPARAPGGRMASRAGGRRRLPLVAFALCVLLALGAGALGPPPATAPPPASADRHRGKDTFGAACTHASSSCPR